MRRLAKSWIAARRHRGQKGQTLIIMAFLSIFLITLLGLVVDSVRLYVLAAQAERAAEAGALAGALYMPTYFSQSTPPFSPDGESAQKRACEVLKQNGITNCPATAGQVGAQVSMVVTNQYEVQVTVTLQTDVFFLAFVSPNLSSTTVSRSALAEFLPPIEMGSQYSYFGDQADGSQNFWASINGPSNLKEQGDAYTPTLEEGPTDAHQYPDNSTSSNAYAYNRFPTYQGGKATNHDQYGQTECVGCVPTAPIANPDVQPTGFAGYNYEIIVPANSGTVQVEIYNPAFVNGDSTTSDIVANDADKDPTFKGKDDQPNEYMQMNYTLYTAPLLFERSQDQQVPSTVSNPIPFQPPSLDLADSSLLVGGSGLHCTGTPSTPYWNPQSGTCVADPGYINKWYTLYTIPNSGSQQIFRLSVQATGYYGSKNYGLKLVAQNPLKGLSIFAWNNMCLYFSLTGKNGTSTFDLAEIPADYAGKTLNFDLFDPGDTSGNAYMEILDPSNNAVQLASPSDTKIRTTNNGTELEASLNGDRIYNGLWLKFLITIPSNYSPTAGQDWWQIEYQTPNGKPTDKITISVGLSGSPVHLVNEIP